ncbi:ABC transporter substrate-binding protein [Sphingomonas sp. ID0503]|uniref:ABC transporter substrate-binding protein n=1 Tax=Sphingomonas sp. ID0503 TaxID=3399691 RepID=UPI003AFA5C20
MRARAFLLLAPLLLAGCDALEVDDHRVVVSVIGSDLSEGDPGRGPVDPARAAYVSATAQGLVSFDAAGEIAPGLAERWIVSDDGLAYDFRLRRTAFAGGREVDAERVARLLRAMVAKNSRNPLLPVLGAVDRIVAMPNQVVEIRLRGPRPNLLQLLAQPEMALTYDGRGTGPFAAEIDGKTVARLTLPAPNAVGEDGGAAPALDPVILHAERVGRAIARFRRDESDAVLGGTFLNLAVGQAAKLPPTAWHFDPVEGLFGLVVADTSGFLALPGKRTVLAMALDRAALLAPFSAQGWTAQTAIVPRGMPDLPTPAEPGWANLDLAVRRAIAVQTVTRWREEHEGAAPHLRVAIPQGPGATVLFALLARQWREIGVTAERVAADADADLRLVDSVAPADNAAWYLRHFSCDRSPACDPTADAALVAARFATTLPARAAALAQADRILVGTVPFIPLARPLRWSLAYKLDGFQANRRGVHPLRPLVDTD